MPPKWSNGVLDFARDMFATHLLASASFSPRWGGSPDGQTFVVRERWTWSAHARSAVEEALVRAVVSGSYAEGSGTSRLTVAVSMFDAAEAPFHEAHMYLAFKWLLEQNLEKESGGAEVAKVAVVEAMLSFKLEHGQWALGCRSRNGQEWFRPPNLRL